jgi:hypothetical protein
MGGRQAVRPRTLDPVSKVRILPAQPVYQSETGKKELNHISKLAPFIIERRALFLPTALFL